jgi:GNAT superfamily N-acetyltransferase
MLSFEDVNVKNWGKVVHSVIKSELTYKKSIRTSRWEYAQILSDGDAIGKIAFFDNTYVGNTIAYPPTKPELKDYKLDKPEFAGIKYLYLFNFIVVNGYRGEGIGSKLLKEFLISAKEQGYDRVIGHYRPNASFELIKRYGATVIEVCKNWENTKEDYVFCEIDLKKFDVIEPLLVVRN